MSFQSTTHQIQDYQVETDLYAGPLDLLLQLIERAELDITRLSLAKVTDQYLEYLNALQQRNAAEVSAFLVIAARLVQIKSSALLPHPQPPGNIPEEEDLGEALARQLIIYKRFKELAGHLQHREEIGAHTYLRMAPPQKMVTRVNLDLSGMTLDDLVLAARDIFFSHPVLANLDQVVSMQRITIREKIRSILATLTRIQQTTFRTMLIPGTTRIDTVVTFLAMLELIKRRIVAAEQESLFGDIEITVDQTLDLEETLAEEFEGYLIEDEDTDLLF